MPELIVSAEQSGRRLDVVLADYDNRLSRSSWQKLVERGLVEINGQIVTDSSDKVLKGSAIRYKLPDIPEVPVDSVPIIYQDSDVIVFNKPSGLLTHAKGQLSQEWTLSDVARPLVEDDGTNRPGIVHRLDRDTSGVIIVARNERAKQILQKQFAGRHVFKRYIALVQGVLTKDHYSLSWPLARDLKSPSTFKVDLSGKKAATEVSVISRQDKTTMVALVPATGRTHQLRVHLKHLGHPILGDRIYGSSVSASRLMLHAERLKLNLPSGAAKEFIAPLGKDFKEEIKRHEP